MKTKYFIFGAFFTALFFIGCKSREEKALETIRDAMFKTLYNFESYEPIETTVDSLQYDMYGDTLVHSFVMRMKLMDTLIDDYDKEYRDAKKIFDIWDDPRMYYYSDFAYNKRKNAYEDMQKALLAKTVAENVRGSYLDSLIILKQNHSSELYGWRVHHRFRCKTKGGSPDLCDYVYFMDRKCEKIYLTIDEKDFNWGDYVDYVRRAYEEAYEQQSKEQIEVDSIMFD